ncbi:Tat pathway signal protein [uncultured Methylobacterium sp.]|uniref:Tat pathway signal protein n=1 Tax=uncultured Methylobacterium sp. TaxID=157278 RepID=UPI0035C9FB0C
MVQVRGRGMPLYRLKIWRLALDTAACLALSLVFVVSFLASALAQDAAPAEKAPPIKLQLNRMESAGEACRATMLVDNSRGTPLKSYKIDLFAFDTDGIAQKRVAVELGPIPARKTTVKIFDFPGIACAKVGRVLLNDVLACEGRDACLEHTETETKASVSFDR